MRELWGRYWIFAHNGNLLEFAPALDGSFIPVGLTDSERAFCWLLQELRRRFGSQPPSDRAVLFDALHQLTLDITRFGEFNFLLSNGDCLFAHASTKLSHIVRQAPFAQAHLKDQDLTVDFSDVTSPDDRVAVIATLPLTDNETWTDMPPGTLWWFEEGAPVKTLPTRPGPIKNRPDRGRFLSMGSASSAQDSLRNSSSALSISASIAAASPSAATAGCGPETRRDARMTSS